MSKFLNRMPPCLNNRVLINSRLLTAQATKSNPSTDGRIISGRSPPPGDGSILTSPSGVTLRDLRLMSPGRTWAIPESSSSIIARLYLKFTNASPFDSSELFETKALKLSLFLDLLAVIRLDERLDQFPQPGVRPFHNSVEEGLVSAKDAPGRVLFEEVGVVMQGCAEASAGIDQTE